MRGARAFGQTFGLSIVIYVVALACHEVMHLVTLYAMGFQGTLIVRPWRFSFVPITIDAFHAQPAQPLAFLPHIAFDLAGPALALALLGLLTLAVRDRLARIALVANLLVLVFYAVIEPLDVVLDAAGVDLRFLLWAEFNYGVPLLILLGAAAYAARSPRDEERELRQATWKPPRLGPVEHVQGEAGAGEG